MRLPIPWRQAWYSVETWPNHSRNFQGGHKYGSAGVHPRHFIYKDHFFCDLSARLRGIPQGHRMPRPNFPSGSISLANNCSGYSENCSVACGWSCHAHRHIWSQTAGRNILQSGMFSRYAVYHRLWPVQTCLNGDIFSTPRIPISLSIYHWFLCKFTNWVWFQQNKMLQSWIYVIE